MFGKFVLIVFLLLPLTRISSGYAQIIDSADKDFFNRVRDSLVYDLGHPDTLGGRRINCYFNTVLSETDSFSVIAANYYNRYGKDADYALIVHNKYSKGHSSFSFEKIKGWKDRHVDEVTLDVLKKCDTLHTRITGESGWFNDLRGFWVPVKKYQGEYYLHNDWACLVAYELTDSAFMNINMEVYPEMLFVAQGGKKGFTLQTNRGTWQFLLIDRKREIYQVTEITKRWKFHYYLIPARRIHDFEIIEYVGTNGDLIVSFVKFDER